MTARTVRLVVAAWAAWMLAAVGVIALAGPASAATSRAEAEAACVGGSSGQNAAYSGGVAWGVDSTTSVMDCTMPGSPGTLFALRLFGACSTHTRVGDLTVNGVTHRYTMPTCSTWTFQKALLTWPEAVAGGSVLRVQWVSGGGVVLDYVDMDDAGPAPTPSPSAEPTAEPTGQPTAEPTALPTAEPTTEPTTETTPSPSATTDPLASPSPSSSPSAEPSPSTSTSPSLSSSPSPPPYVPPTDESASALGVLAPFIGGFAALVAPLAAWQVGAAALERAGR